MGKLVYLDRHARYPKARPASGTTGQVVLFTGVRYERDGTPLPGKPIGSAKKRRRG